MGHAVGVWSGRTGSTRGVARGARGRAVSWVALRRWRAQSVLFESACAMQCGAHRQGTGKWVLCRWVLLAVCAQVGASTRQVPTGGMCTRVATCPTCGASPERAWMSGRL